MTSTPETGTNEDVNDFLLRIRELGEKRDKEDEERTKKLEEEILQGRKERQARRAERARSISPTKDSSPIIDPARLSMSSLSHRAIDPPEQLDPTPQTPVHDIHTKSNTPQDETITSRGPSPAGSRLGENEIGTSPKAPSPSLRSRAGTLSWQQRPTSRDLSGNRPFFSTSPSRENRWRAMSNASNDERGTLRSAVVSSLSPRESAFLRQQEGDSPSLQNKNVEEDAADTPTNDVQSKEPVTERESTTEPTKDDGLQDTTEERSPSPSRASSTFADSSLGFRYSSVSSVSTTTGLGSPIPLSSAQKFEPPRLDEGSDGQESLPPSPRRLSPERSASPTKGLGGFVQSAMMKRSDSISKRWSAQLPSGLSRSNSFASNRNSFAAPSNGDIFSASPISKLNREGSALSPHRPSSSHSEATIVHQTKDGERPATPPVSGGSENTGRPSLSLHARSASAISVDQPQDSSPVPTTPPVSRTMDQKRWSPTKSTWLESALNRPESPRHTRHHSQQLPWNKDRQSRSSVDLGRPSSFKEVTPVGLLRTAPLGNHSAKSSISGIPDVLNTQDNGKPKEDSPTDPNPAPEESNPQPGTPNSVITPTTLEATTVPTGISEDSHTRQAASPISLSPILKTNNIDIPLSSPREPLRDPLLHRPKAQSPVIDFRANLRKREVIKDQSSKAEPEFKNVFGKLKKTETSTYVPPDELKENILRGKAALTVTSGPKRSQRVDEFKESLLKQKEAIKSSGGSLRRNTAGERDAPHIRAIPEAIAKRNNLAKPGNVQGSPSGDTDTLSLSSPKETEAPKSSYNEQIPVHHDDHTQPIQPVQIADEVLEPVPDDYQDEASKSESRDSCSNDGVGLKTTDEHSKAVEEEEEEEKLKEETIEPVRALPSGNVTQATSTPAVKEGLVTKGSLAGRINPALANLISRGPPAAIEGSKKTVSVINSKESALDSQDSESGPTLTHMTKTRARGPKRRPPKASTSTANGSDSRGEAISPETPVSSFGVESLETSSSSIEKTPDTPSGWPLPEQGINSNFTSGTASSQANPVTAIKATDLTKSLPQLPKQDTILFTNPSQTLESKKLEDGERLKGSPLIKPLFSPPRSAPSPSSPLASQSRSPLAQYSTPSPSPLRTSFKENHSRVSPRVTGASNLFSRSQESSPFRKSLPSPPVPPKGPNVSVDELSSQRSSVSLVPQADESLAAISNFFKTFPSSSDRVNIDPQFMLSDKRDNSKIRTLRRQIWEITEDGKKQDLPVNQEYILYEGAMYLCVHLFEVNGTTRSEAHLWCGDDVWEGALDDALAFSRRIARDNGCKLEVIKQGKEPGRFIQALGGILITRRGSSSRSSSSAIFMLCGRKHLGQMVFDEVDLSPSNLCTGYPFVISAMFGTVYLWKGKGSSAEEIGAARLIGMDLGLTGEFEEVSEGEEPPTFFEVFPQNRGVGNHVSSGNWLLKPAHEHFGLRLLRIDHELGQRSGFWIRRPGSSSPVIRPNDTVQEVEPFCEKDLSPKGIYVLDTFFEIYVIVGEQASNRPAEFASAVVFAHEYGILAASLQDRPFIPKSFVSLGGPPESCRSAFRKWSKHSLLQLPQVFPLNAAIDAIRS